jgi:hypothetical protein
MGGAVCATSAIDATENMGIAAEGVGIGPDLRLLGDISLTDVYD